jgi:peptide subunit release factor 1 (eRF1)
MFGERELKELAGYESSTPVLSLYLNVDPRQQSTDEYRLELRQLLKQAAGAASRADIDAVRAFFDHQYDWSGRGVAVFSCVADGFWHVYPLAVAVASNVTVASRPYVWPLAALVEAYGRYCVAIVDRRGARILVYEMGELRADEQVVGEEVRRVKRGKGSRGGHGRRGGSMATSQRQGEAVRRNIRDAVEATRQVWRRHGPEHLIIGGTERTAAQFTEALPRRLRASVVGTISADMNTSLPDIRERSLDLIREMEVERESALVDAVFTAAAKGRGGAIRLADTLGAAHEGRIQTLVVSRGFHQPGYQCKGCAYITDQALETCPFCGRRFREIPDAAEALVKKVIEDGGRVEIIDDNARIAEFGVGALLRY